MADVNDLLKQTADALSDAASGEVPLVISTSAEASTRAGDKYNVEQLFNVNTSTPLYVLFDLPVGADVNVILAQRFFKTKTDGAQIRVLWDYDVSTATKTPLTVFNSNNNFRGVKDSQFEVSVLNPVTITDGVADVTGAATVISDGIVRESDFVVGTGSGNNSAGGVTTSSGGRLYVAGTGFLIKITSDGNDNETQIGYTFTEESV